MLQKHLRPFKYLSHLVHSNEALPDKITMLPISMDASSSAYQIMSYLLLKNDLAERTNLIRRKSKEKIFDLYSSLMVEKNK